MICVRKPKSSEPVVGKCPECGHQFALHPGKPNENLEACIACVINTMDLPMHPRNAEEPFS